MVGAWSSVDATLVGDATPVGDTARPGSGAAPPRIGRYRLGDRIGSGATAAVFRARDDELQRDVAIKLLDGGRPDPTGRLLQEAKSLARLSHPNVVEVFDVGPMPDGWDSGIYLAMELLDGEPFDRWLATRPAWPRVVEAFIEAGAGLAAAHEAGIVHRDFKPANAMRCDDGRVVVIDFGIALTGPVEMTMEGTNTASADRTGDRRAAGTPAYMSPEQIHGAELDERSDVFSFCVSLWEGLYGERPFADESAAVATAAILAGELRRRPRDAPVPGWLHAMVRKGLHLDPEDRWASMPALVAALRGGRNRRRPWMPIALAAPVLFGAGWLAMVARDPCEDAGSKIAAVWNDERSAALGDRLASDPDTLEAIRIALDAYARQWEALARRRCVAAHDDTPLAAADLDRRSECLATGLRETEELLQRIEDDDVDAEAARRLANRLPALGPCDEGVRDNRGGSDQVVIRAKELEALIVAGDYDAAEGIADEVVREAHRLEHDEAILIARKRRGQLHRIRGRYDEAVEDCRVTYERALSLGESHQTWQAALACASVELVRQSPDAASPWLDAAEAQMKREDPPAQDRGQALMLRGALSSLRGDDDGAIDLFRESIVHLESGGVPTHQLASTLTNFATSLRAVGRLTEAEAALSRSLEIRSDLVDEPDSSLMPTLVSMAEVQLALGRPERGVAWAQRAAQLFEAAHGPDHVQLPTLWGRIVRGYIALGQPELALPWAERSLEIVEAEGFEDGLVAGNVHAGLARVLTALGRHEDASVHFRRAVVELEAEGETGQRALASAELHRARSLAGRDRREEALALVEQAYGRLHDAGDACAGRPELCFELARLLPPEAHERSVALARTSRRALGDREGEAAVLRAEVDQWLSRHALRE